MALLKEQETFFVQTKENLDDLNQLCDILDENNQAQVQEKLNQIEAELKAFSQKIMLAGPYDKNSAILTIKSGAGGRDAEDWTCLLFEMYKRFCLKKGWGLRVLAEYFGEAGGPEGRIGLKEISFEVKGQYAYGFLKKEAGVHRLVRLSPFSANSLRHTSFSKVEVLPKLEEGDLTEINLKSEELRVDTYRSQGKGGQNVNKRETAVRITHLPTGIAVSCQVERFQARNKEVAMSVLKAKLVSLKEQERAQEIQDLKGKNVKIEFGHQIRSYVFQPYQLVKDARTGVETANIEAVMAGDLDKFIEAEIGI